MKQNPFKMKGPWIGAIAGFIFYFVQIKIVSKSNPSKPMFLEEIVVKLFDIHGMVGLIYMLFTYIIIGFLIGWAIQHFMSKRRK